MSIAESLFASLVIRDSLVARLAERASLAVRLEPGLLRRLRLEFVPKADASAETELWSSPLVQSRSPSQIAFAPRVLACLRARLAEDQEGLQKTYRFLEKAHEKAPPLVRLEEALIFAGLSNPVDSERISQLLREVIASMREGPSRARALSSWVMTNFAAWPLPVQQCEEARALALVAGTRVPRLTAVDPGFPSQRGIGLVRELLPTLERRTVRLQRSQRYLVFGFASSTSESPQLSVPASSPRFEVIGHGSVTVTERPQRLHVGDEHTLTLRTPEGETFALTPRVDDWNILRRATLAVYRRTDASTRMKAEGSGFLVRPNVAFTAWHVVAEVPAHELCVTLHEPFEQRTVSAVVRRPDTDVAALVLSSPVAGRVPLDKFGSAAPRAMARTVFYGNGIGIGIGGTPSAIEGHIEALADNDNFTLVPNSNLQDLSRCWGAPVVVHGEVVGLLVRLGPSFESANAPPRLNAVRSRSFAELLHRSASADGSIDQELVTAARRGKREVLELTSKLGSRLNPTAMLAAGERAIGEGYFTEALVLLELAPRSIRNEQLRALALSKLKRHAEALPILQSLIDQGYADAETLSLLAASYKRLWLADRDPEHLKQALDRYREAYQLTGDSYPGINFAALALYRGERDVSLRVAQELVAALIQPSQTSTDAWKTATLAEALLLTENLRDARQTYRAAVNLSAGRWQDVAVMRRQARINLGYLKLDRVLLDDVFPIPTAVAFAGYPVDGPGISSWFPSSKLDVLRTRLRAFLSERNVQMGYSSVARGADLIFIDEVLRRSGAVTVFLPEVDEAFKEKWVGLGWEGTFAQVTTDPRVNVRRVQAPDPQGSDEYFACQDAALRFCADSAAQLDQAPILVLVSPFSHPPLLDVARALPGTDILTVNPTDL